MAKENFPNNVVSLEDFRRKKEGTHNPSFLPKRASSSENLPPQYIRQVQETLGRLHVPQEQYNLEYPLIADLGASDIEALLQLATHEYITKRPAFYAAMLDVLYQKRGYSSL